MGSFFDFPLQWKRERERERERERVNMNFSMGMYINVLSVNKRIGYFPNYHITTYHVAFCYETWPVHYK